MSAVSMTSDLPAYLSTISECPICKEPFGKTTRLPKLLPPCGHTICLECGLGICRCKCLSSQGGDRFSCPVCRHVVRIPKGGIAKMPNNLAMLELVQIRDLVVNSGESNAILAAVEQLMINDLKCCEERLKTAASDVTSIGKDIMEISHRRRSNSLPRMVTRAVDGDSLPSAPDGSGEVESSTAGCKGSSGWRPCGSSVSTGDVRSRHYHHTHAHVPHNHRGQALHNLDLGEATASAFNDFRSEIFGGSISKNAGENAEMRDITRLANRQQQQQQQLLQQPRVRQTTSKLQQQKRPLTRSLRSLQRLASMTSPVSSDVISSQRSTLFPAQLINSAWFWCAVVTVVGSLLVNVFGSFNA